MPETNNDTAKKEVNIIIISDAAGDTAFNNATAAAAEFPDAKVNYRRYPFITDLDKLNETFEEIEKFPNLVIIYSLVKDEMQLPVIRFAREHNIQSVDIFSPVVEALQATTGMRPMQKIGAQHNLNQKYFDRISAMEFAVMYDDGKDPKGFLEADVVLLGVSRTSKTPLSLFLANKNLKVANLPLVPQTHIPKEIYQVDPKKIIGLTNDPSVLNEIRRQRMISYGLNPDTTYSSMDSINEELESAKKLYRKLGCYVVNVAHRSIEETAALIMHHLGVEDQ
ncbi:pyruvate, water dikinase regulatory protein [Lactobacillus gigeriorum]|uniref:Putative pyruvate, phosphate dikinase regulatory protein n=1 Tax=Lactobacillus gigeriorum DSM 23908 = CRBIP 24.85 TaxID=1423751 RepID=I7J3N6_9LACO|nr:pyruvate, water dikinase regulatory protein [Lactobacillus gigeriorum]KRN14541.1 putative cytosolic protein [Lactobacillus gigeriorum DSM 23908 = CRBIP 24.85]CCI87862.1 Putative phosphotransferase LBHH_0855 [Lactobacillus gigeriorum DSM 23908 = CRBIP 24.85]